MSNKESTSFLLKTAKSQYGTPYRREVRLGGDDCRIDPQSWLAMVLDDLATRSSLSPLDTSEVGFFKAIIDLLARDAKCWELMNGAPARIGRKDVISLFTKMERAVETHLFNRWNPANCARASNVFRRWMAGLLPEGTFSEDVSRHVVFYKTSLLARHHPRSTLSDSIDRSVPSQPVPPLDATPHSNLKELRASIEGRLDRDIERLIDACVAELSKWNGVRTRLQELSRTDFSAVERYLARTALRGKLSAEGRDGVRKMGFEKFLGACSLVSTRAQAPLFQALNYRDAFISGILQNVLNVSNADLAGLREGHVIMLAQRVHSVEMIAAFLLLLVHTAWNGSSLRAMERGRIQQVKGGYVIQGFKSKTDDDSPTVYLDSEHKGAAAAIELLTWNHSQLKEMGCIAPTEQRLWFSWSSGKKVLMHEQFSMLRPFKIFKARYKLPHFSFDQIRTHMLVRAGVKTRNPEYVRRLAGHASISTTGHYFEQVMTFKLSRAINLEYQRRLENTVKWDMQFSGKRREIHADEQYVDHTILVPVGDETACVDPKNPPDPTWIQDGTCDAKRCHVGSGCTANRIVLNRSRLEEVFRMEMYFRRDWRRLYERNPEAFEAYHGPAMLFNLVLVNYIQKSLYWPDVQPLLDEWGVK